jgi:hypothetical protein
LRKELCAAPFPSNSPGKQLKIITIEDPVEFNFKGVIAESVPKRTLRAQA